MREPRWAGDGVAQRHPAPKANEQLAKAVSPLDADIDVSSSLLDGDAGGLLARASRELDLLVVSPRGGMDRCALYLLGSLSTGLFRSAESPLVVVPRGADGESASQGSTSPRRIA
jgi:nucleotide-binding universal stress UspA family protein